MWRVRREPNATRGTSHVFRNAENMARYDLCRGATDGATQRVMSGVVVILRCLRGIIEGLKSHRATPLDTARRSATPLDTSVGRSCDCWLSNTTQYRRSHTYHLLRHRSTHRTPYRERTTTLPPLAAVATTRANRVLGGRGVQLSPNRRGTAPARAENLSPVASGVVSEERQTATASCERGQLRPGGHPAL